jgi:hypothetical protein
MSVAAIWYQCFDGRIADLRTRYQRLDPYLTGKRSIIHSDARLIFALLYLPWRVNASSVVTQVSQQNWLFRQPHLGLTTGDPVEP